MFILIPLLLSVVVFQEPALDQVGGHGQSSYEYVGCHVVDENPKDGNVAFGPLGVKILQVAIILVPTYITAYISDKMIYVIPMLAAVSFIAASISPSKLDRRVEEDDGTN